MDIKNQLVEKIKGATNILVTVSSNPTVDQLSACIGLTLMLDEIGKRATAVYSGETPSTIEFLKPEATIEKDPNSLRDFIIALDKAKADKLRYKVEDDIVKIFITPYKTALSEQDFDFSQGDVNVDLVIALGVKQQEELDQAITAHGRILHDATVVTINNTPDGELGGLNWFDGNASSLCEQVATLASSFDKYKLDQQVATALLTGIVAATERFSNAQTSASTMTVSAALISAGADQQLVASELEKPEPQPEPEPEPEPNPAPEPEVPEVPAAEAPPLPEPEVPVTPPADDGSLILTHDEPATTTPEAAAEIVQEPAAPTNEIHIDEEGRFHPDGMELPSIGEVKTTDVSSEADNAAEILTKAPEAEAPAVESQPNQTETDEMPVDLLNQATLVHDPLMGHDVPPLVSPAPPVLSGAEPASGDNHSQNQETLADIEAQVTAEEKPAGAPMAAPAPAPESAPEPPEMPSLGGMKVIQPPVEAAPGLTPADQPMDMPLPSVVPPNGTVQPNNGTDNGNPLAPPPVPPPMVPPPFRP